MKGALELFCVLVVWFTFFGIAKSSSAAFFASKTCNASSGVNCTDACCAGAGVNFCANGGVAGETKCCCTADNVTGDCLSQTYTCGVNQTCGPSSTCIPSHHTNFTGTPRLNLTDYTCKYPLSSSCYSDEYCCNNDEELMSWCATNYSYLPPTVRCCCLDTGCSQGKWQCLRGDYCGSTYNSCIKPLPTYPSDFAVALPSPSAKTCKYPLSAACASTDICCDSDYEKFSECVYLSSSASPTTSRCCCDKFYGCEYRTWVCTDPRLVCGDTYSEYCVNPPQLPAPALPPAPSSGWPATNFSITFQDTLGYCRYATDICSYKTDVCCDSNREQYSSCFSGSIGPQICCCDAVRGCAYDMWTCTGYGDVCGRDYLNRCVSPPSNVISTLTPRTFPAVANTSQFCTYSTNDCRSSYSSFGCCNDNITRFSWCGDETYDSTNLPLSYHYFRTFAGTCCCDAVGGCAAARWVCGEGYVCSSSGGYTYGQCDYVRSGPILDIGPPPAKVKVIPIWMVAIPGAVIVIAAVALIVMCIKFRPRKGPDGDREVFIASLKSLGS